MMRPVMTAIKVIVPDFKSMTLSQVIQATIAASLVYIGITYEEQRRQDLALKEPAENWIEITRLDIPDHIIGQGHVVPIVYERDLKREFIGRWHIEEQRLGEDGKLDAYRLCDSTDIIPYNPAKRVPQNVTLGWLLEYDKDGRAPACRWVNPQVDFFPEGQYRMCLSIEVILEGDRKYTRPFCTGYYNKMKKP